MRKDDPARQLKRLFTFNKPSDERKAFLKKIGRLPPGLDPSLAEKIFRAMFVEIYHSTWTDLITPEYARPALRACQAKDLGFFQAHGVWIAAAVDADADDERLAAQLRDAFAALKRLHTPTYVETRAGLDATLPHDRWIEATRAAVAATSDDWYFSEPMLALLMADGSDASVDVLIPRALRAIEEKKDELDKLRRLAKRFGAKTPEMEAFRARFKSETDERARSSGVNELAAAIGLAARDDFEFEATFHGVRKNGARIFEVDVGVDAADACWGRMRLMWVGGRRWCQNEWTSDEEKVYSNNYPLKKLERLPGWLGDIAVARRCTFKLSSVKTNLTGADADRLRAWLKSATVPKKTGFATTRTA